MRYVDDFVLLDESRDCLRHRLEQIEQFLGDDLLLELHPERRLIRPVSNGIDFLGYIVRPSYLRVRRRVVARCRDSLAAYSTAMTVAERRQLSLRFPGPSYDRLRATVQSYLAIFAFAGCCRLVEALFTEFPLLPALFRRHHFRLVKRWELPFRPGNLYTQYRFFRARFSGRIVIQVGCFLELFDDDALWAAEQTTPRKILPRRRFTARCGCHIRHSHKLARQLTGQNVLWIMQSGEIGHNLARRIATRLDHSCPTNHQPTLALPVATTK